MLPKMATEEKQMTKPVVFISYSRKDEEEKKQLVKHLRVLQGAIDTWSDDRIGPGVDWKQAIEQAMAEAKVAILLISVNLRKYVFNYLG